MQKIKLFILFGLFASMFLGELARIPIYNGISFSLLDIFSFFSFIFVCLRFIKEKEILKNPITKPLLIFISICFISLLVNAYSLTTSQFFISLLYIFRLIFISSIFFFTADIAKKTKDKIPFFLVGIGVLLVIIGIIQYFYIDFVSLSFLDWDIHWYRLFSTFIDPNFMGVYLVLC